MSTYKVKEVIIFCIRHFWIDNSRKFEIILKTTIVVKSNFSGPWVRITCHYVYMVYVFFFSQIYILNWTDTLFIIFLWVVQKFLIITMLRKSNFSKLSKGKVFLEKGKRYNKIPWFVHKCWNTIFLWKKRKEKNQTKLNEIENSKKAKGWKEIGKKSFNENKKEDSLRFECSHKDIYMLLLLTM